MEKSTVIDNLRFMRNELIRQNEIPTHEIAIKIRTLEAAAAELEKQIPKKPERVLIKHGKHRWRRKESGEIDEFAWEYEHHNGVACEICGETVCVCCNPDYDQLTDCEEEYWICPNCGKKMRVKNKHCDCGQIIDWGSEEPCRLQEE